MMSTVCIDAAVGDQSAAVGEDDHLGPVVHVDLGQDHHGPVHRDARQSHDHQLGRDSWRAVRPFDRGWLDAVRLLVRSMVLMGGLPGVLLSCRPR
jgi:hypothetical protein